MHRREPHLCRARQVELVALDLVDVHLVGRQEAGAVHRLLAHEHGRQHDGEALLHEPVERVAVERELEESEVADAVREARARHLGGALHVDPAERLGEVEVILDREVERRRLADAPNLDRVVVREAVGRVLGRRVRHQREQLAARRLGGRQALLERLQLGLHLLELRELLGRRLSLELPFRPQLLHVRLDLEHGAVGGHQLVERVGCAFPHECGAERVRIAAGGAKIDHERESR